MAQRHKTGGRQRGTPKKITAAFKDAVRCVYSDIGGDTAFAQWARENQTEFYRIAARLIPTEIAAREGTVVNVIIAPYGVEDMSSVPMVSGQVLTPQLSKVC